MLEYIKTFFTDYTVRNVALGSALLGILSGALGVYAVLRKRSLVGDAISHAALPGIALAFMLTQSRSPLILLAGAFVAGWIGMLMVSGVVNISRIKDDTALGIILSVFFGFGLVLLTFIQKIPDARQAGLDKYLFGQAATLMQGDVILMAILSAVSFLMMYLFWKEFKLLTFDPNYGSSLGFPMRLIDIMQITLIVIAIVIGLQTVGVVLMSAMIIAPAAAARQWTDRLFMMVLLSALFGAFAGVSGALLSSTTSKLPTGPVIVLVITIIVIFSMLFAPNRGIVWKYFQFHRHKMRITMQTVLLELYYLSIKHNYRTKSYSLTLLQAITPDRIGVKKNLRELERRGWVRLFGSSEWALTDAGFEHAQKITEKTSQE
ncbi:MAG: metal ABC transporter permease [Candidatus Auribacterota bacterium]|jgi:manganese/zinc/iron transport system permease protein|uniref:Metal ABC transporter permease n=1 Tax=Candidatus Auribacter fodinae TaxID=2093366 RepID=A0A3A4R4S3_9BACT|nr:MAG: metal ABC transporter permease [Candidatus Auribacter fodinae]